MYVHQTRVLSRTNTIKNSVPPYTISFFICDMVSLYDGTMERHEAF